MRLNCSVQLAPGVAAQLTTPFLRSVFPYSMNVQVSMNIYSQVPVVQEHAYQQRATETCYGHPTLGLAQIGVYLYRSRLGAPLYVGNSVNLRQGMLSYFGSDLTRLETCIKQMAFSIRSFEFRVTASEPMTLLLESALTKQKTPIFNVRQQEYQQYRYVVLMDDSYPTCKIVGHQESIDGRTFGPFRDGCLAVDTLGTVNRYFQLRWCVDAQPFRKILNFDLGFCTGLCRNRILVEDYAQIVDWVVRFLNGDEEWVADKLERDMTRSS